MSVASRDCHTLWATHAWDRLDREKIACHEEIPHDGAKLHTFPISTTMGGVYKPEKSAVYSTIARQLCDDNHLPGWLLAFQYSLKHSSPHQQALHKQMANQPTNKLESCSSMFCKVLFQLPPWVNVNKPMNFNSIIMVTRYSWLELAWFTIQGCPTLKGMICKKDSHALHQTNFNITFGNCH